MNYPLMYCKVGNDIYMSKTLIPTKVFYGYVEYNFQSDQIGLVHALDPNEKNLYMTITNVNQLTNEFDINIYLDISKDSDVVELHLVEPFNKVSRSLSSTRLWSSIINMKSYLVHITTNVNDHTDTVPKPSPLDAQNQPIPVRLTGSGLIENSKQYYPSAIIYKYDSSNNHHGFDDYSGPYEDLS